MNLLKQIGWATPSTAAAALGLALASAGCERNQGAEGVETIEGEVVERSVQGVDKKNLGEQNVEEGEEEVTVRRRLVVRQTEDVDIPTVRICDEYADLNEIDAKGLVALGVSQNVADAIVQYREQNGPFQSADQLSQVPGVEQNVYNQLAGIVAVPTQQAPAGDAGP